jgi:hypothetical protein
MLRGDGRGGLVPVPPLETGLVVPGDAKALAVIDLGRDGWPGFLVSRNNAGTLAFRNRGRPGRRSLRIALRGARGNPTAVGARVTVEAADGSAQSSEVACGSGQGSQSSAAQFFGYPESNPLVRARVRWPSGAETTHGLSGAAAAITLESPDRPPADPRGP